MRKTRKWLLIISYLLVIFSGCIFSRIISDIHHNHLNWIIIDIIFMIIFWTFAYIIWGFMLHGKGIRALPNEGIYRVVSHQGFGNFYHLCLIENDEPDHARAPVYYFKVPLFGKNSEKVKMIGLDIQWMNFLKVQKSPDGVKFTFSHDLVELS